MPTGHAQRRRRGGGAAPAETREPPPGTFRAALGNTEFRRLVTAYLASAIGQTFGVVAMTVAMFDRTRSAGWVAAISAARLLPYIVAPGVAGVIAARVPRRRLLAASAGARVVLTLLLGLAVAQSAPPLVLVGLAALFTAVGMPCYPAMAAAVPAILTADDLAPGNGLLTAVETMSFIAGPAIGGVVLILGSPATAITANAAIFVVAAGLAARLAAAPPPAASPGPIIDELLAGMRSVRAAPELAAPIILVVAVNLTYGGALVALVVYAHQVLGGRAGFGLLNAGLGVGALLGAATTNRLARARRQLLVLGAATLLAGVPFALLGGVQLDAVAAALMVGSGAGCVATEVLAVTLVQRVLAQERLAHVFGLLDSLIFAALFAGSILAPLLVYTVGVRVALAVLGAVIPGAALVISARLARGARRQIDSDVTARVALLGGLPWLRDALVPALEALAVGARTEEVASGTRVIEEGAVPDDFFVVVRGALTVRRRTHRGEEAIAVLGPGDGFGEIGLLERVPRTASVVADERSLILRVQGTQFVATVNAVASAAAAALGGGLLGRLGVSPADREGSGPAQGATHPVPTATPSAPAPGARPRDIL